MSLPLATQRRRSQRLRDYDYGAPGAYFVTICAHERKAVFGEHMVDIITAAWQAIPARFPGVEVDSFVVMPNHVHGIIIIADWARPGRETRGEGSQRNVGEAHEPPLQATNAVARRRVERSRMLLPQAIAYFKMNAAKRINLLRGSPGAPVWQRSYYERVIRGEAELARIRQYIQGNAARWEEDPENPAAGAYSGRRGGSRAAPANRPSKRRRGSASWC